MSEVITPVSDPAIDIIDEQVRVLDADIAANTRRVELDAAVRDRLLAVRATLARKLRPRKARPVTEVPANDTAEDPTPRPTVFAAPSMEAA
jgi:hypothetical protein